MLKAIFIDIDNTLLDFDKGSECAIDFACANLGVEKTPALLKAFFSINPKLWHDVDDGIITMTRLFEIRWNTIFQSVGISADGQTFEKLYHSFLQDSAIPMDGATDALKHLSLVAPIYTASNAPHAQQLGRLEKANMLQYITDTFTSELLGATKPSKEFFDACFARIFPKLSPAETLMIGDSIHSDILGAANYGMKTCWFNPKFLPAPQDVQITHQIHSLHQIKDLIL